MLAKGEAAARLLLDGAPPTEVVLPTELVVRGSTGPLTGGGPDEAPGVGRGQTGPVTPGRQPRVGPSRPRRHRRQLVDAPSSPNTLSDSSDVRDRFVTLCS